MYHVRVIVSNMSRASGSHRNTSLTGRVPCSVNCLELCNVNKRIKIMLIELTVFVYYNNDWRCGSYSMTHRNRVLPILSMDFQDSTTFWISAGIDECDYVRILKS